MHRAGARGLMAQEVAHTTVSDWKARYLLDVERTEEVVIDKARPMDSLAPRYSHANRGISLCS